MAQSARVDISGAEAHTRLSQTFENTTNNRIESTYVFPLPLPVVGAAQSASVDVKITSSQGIRAVYSPTHSVDIKREGNTARVSGEWGWKYPEPQPVAMHDDVPRSKDVGGADRNFV